MIRINGIIRLEDEDIVVKSLEYTGHLDERINRLVGEGMKLTLENNKDYTKIQDIGKFSIDFDNVTIDNCVLNPPNRQSIETLGFLEGEITSAEDILKIL